MFFSSDTLFIILSLNFSISISWFTLSYALLISHDSMNTLFFYFSYLVMNIFNRSSCISHDIAGLKPALHVAVVSNTALSILYKRIFSQNFYMTGETVIGLVVALQANPSLDLCIFLLSYIKYSLPSVISSCTRLFIIIFFISHKPAALTYLHLALLFIWSSAAFLTFFGIHFQFLLIIMPLY